VTGDPTFPRRVGEHTLKQHSGTQVATLLRSLGSLEAVLAAVAQTGAKVSTVTDMEAVEVGPGRAVVRAVTREGFTRRPLHCDWAKGLLSGTPLLFGLPLAHVEETECQAQGGAQCLYVATWDAEQAAAAADPQQRVTALEAQLVAMSGRLQSVYATASDLVSTEDLDTVLRRIVERAASTVRAPSHILAVRTDPDAELQVYSHGIDDAEARGVLERASLQSGAPEDDSMLVVDVTSSRRDYGQLIACYPGVNQFFPQERQTLSLYAKHAAAVLDMAVALQDSSLRHEQVSALLSLSHALAQAGTSVEVAERLAAAIPEVVDCDRTRVWLWDESERSLRSFATGGRKAEHAPDMNEVPIRLQDTPYLQNMLNEPKPLFFNKGTDDPFVRQMMATLDQVALTVVPIVTHDAFLGIVTASVSDRPERLRPDSDLLERLTGVASLAAPAIQNGRLVDKLRHRASHDGLTGLLNRVGFRHHIDRVLQDARPGQGRVGLLFVDLDHFKQVNDTYGHEVGDQVIRQAGERLSAIGRGSDEVARLGGDEFAIVLSDVSRDEQVRAAERRVRAAFVEPFVLEDVVVSISASVGGGIWPQDGSTVTDLVRHADAAMYMDKARDREPSVRSTREPLQTSQELA
jgi:diguanylate cyclase (GGDEF)-like protein